MMTAEGEAHKEEVGIKEKPQKAAKFPIKGFVNQWGFIHLKAEVLSALGAAKGEKTLIAIDLKEEALIIRKARSSIGPSVGR
jgi:hypothetical protein